ncbi:hypothetical protein [Exiguobacterium sp. UBA4551]|uniref:hypothetical protein n=1 Tax=Exiguobacterium sp. UBA4551 TaxID=1946494 RepID=UPI00257991BB|nr:hypothetical protein [Exiguobacterium sp. UBA4551]
MIRETWFLMRRSLLVTLRNPFSFIPNLIISVFFLLVYTSGLSGISNLPQFDSIDYLNFILPVSIVSGAVGGAGGAGQALVKDIESGYFARLLLNQSREQQSSSDRCLPGCCNYSFKRYSSSGWPFCLVYRSQSMSVAFS